MHNSQSPMEMSHSVSDVLFTRLARVNVPPPPRTSAALIGLDSVGNRPLPPGVSDSQREEWERIERHLEEQFQLLRDQRMLLERQRLEVMRREQSITETSIRQKCQLERHAKHLEHQTGSLHARALELDTRAGDIESARDELLRTQQEVEEYRREVAEQEMYLQQLRTTTNEVLDSERRARQELVKTEATLQQRWKEWEAAHAEFEAQRQLAEQRLIALQREEQAIERRTREIEELEARTELALKLEREELEREKLAFAQQVRQNELALS